MNILKKNNKGVTLIELIVTMAIFAIIIQVIYSFYFVGNKSFEVSKNIGFAQQDVRLGTEILNAELRYADNIDINNLTGKYYSLEILSNGDGTYYLEKKEYTETDGTIVEDNIKTINGSWKEIIINNNESGIINTTIEQYEDKQKYKIDFDIVLENSNSLNTGIEISSFGSDKIIYYSFPQDKKIQ